MIRIVMILFLVASTSVNLQAQVNIIHTIAGTGEAGYSGDNGPASAAKLNRPSSICISSHDGNIYFVDAANHCVRKISSDIITTLAGTGTPGYNGDNIPASSAQLFAPEGIVIDTDGNMYITDALNYRVRKISAINGMITTIAGDGIVGDIGNNVLAIAAELNGPAGICLDKKNNLYVGDYNNNKVKKIDLLTGIISTVAGNGGAGYSGDNGPATNAQLDGPVDIICDDANNLFIADQWNGCIRKVNSTTGIITTVAGDGTLGYSGNDGPATLAKMNEPAGVFVDAYNNVFIADYRNGAIRKVDGINGNITTIAGGSAGYGGDGGPATDAKLKCVDVWVDNGGSMYIADYVNQRIRKVNGALKVVNYQFNEFALSVHPNPTSGRFEVQCGGNEGVITICDMAGRVVYQSATFAAKIQIDITDEPQGMYMVYVQSGGDRYMSKVLLNK